MPMLGYSTYPSAFLASLQFFVSVLTAVGDWTFDLAVYLQVKIVG